MTYRPDIDGLRAIAVLAVLFFHAGFAGFSGGFIGVDVFFVISGFLITKLIVADGQFSLLGFYQRRARRIFPALTLVMLVASIAAYIFFMPEEFAAFDRRFVIVEDVPVGAEFDVAYAARAMHIQAILGRGHDQLHTTRFGISRERYEIQLASYRPILDEIAKAPNVSIVPLIDQLCDSQFCAGARNGVLLYRDGYHLSKAGGELFSDLFFHVIARADAAQRER